MEPFKKKKLEQEVDEKVLKEYREIQDQLKKCLITDVKLEEKEIKYIGGLDISFFTHDKDRAIVVLTIYDYQKFIELDKKKEDKNDKNDKNNKNNKKNKKDFSLKIDPIYTDVIEVRLTLPYIPGFLAFREKDHYEAILNRLKKNKPEIYPQVLLIDGNGILHCNGFGSACHMGVIMNIATIGVGKTFFNVEQWDEDKVKDEFVKNCKEKGDYFKIVGESGKEYAVAYKSTEEKNSKQCIYVSVGHKLNLDSALQIIKRTSLYKNPEPVRSADLIGRDEIRRLEKIK